MSSVSDAAVSGDRMQTLCAMRDRLADMMDRSTSAMGIASMSKQLQEVLNQIAELTPPDIEDTDLDEFSRRLAAKRERNQGVSDSETGS